MKNESQYPGLKRLRSPDGTKHRSPPIEGSRTQKRKAALRSYTPDERKNGRKVPIAV